MTPFRPRSGGAPRTRVRSHEPAAPWVTPPGSWASSLNSRRTMLSTKGRDTQPERAIRSAAHRLGLRFRVSAQPLPQLRRSADLVFRRERLAVFVDGCFWHSCPVHGNQPAANSTFWREKLARNAERDRDTDNQLRAAGWTALRVWEHEDATVAARRVAEAVELLRAGNE